MMIRAHSTQLALPALTEDSLASTQWWELLYDNLGCSILF